MLDPIVSVFFLNFWDTQIYEIFFSAAPKNSIKMRASCLFFIMKLFFDLANAISTAGALY